MKKLLFISVYLVSCFVVSVQPVDAKKVQTDHRHSKEKELVSVVKDMDSLAAENGDAYAQASIAFRCLEQKDFVCTYKWSSLALLGSYWWYMGEPTIVLSARDKAVDSMSQEERVLGTKQIKNYIQTKLEKENIIVKNLLSKEDTENLSVEELLERAKSGKVSAAGNLSKKCLKAKDYECACLWSSIGSKGKSFWLKDEEILAVRDEARKHLDTKQKEVCDISINDTLADIIGRPRPSLLSTKIKNYATKVVISLFNKNARTKKKKVGVCTDIAKNEMKMPISCNYIYVPDEKIELHFKDIAEEEREQIITEINSAQDKEDERKKQEEEKYKQTTRGLESEFSSKKDRCKTSGCWKNKENVLKFFIDLKK